MNKISYNQLDKKLDDITAVTRTTYNKLIEGLKNRAFQYAPPITSITPITQTSFPK